MKRTLTVVVFLVAMALGQPLAQGTIVGSWQGTVAVGSQSQRVGLIIEQAGTGYGARFVLIDQDNATAQAQVTLDGNTLRVDIPMFRASFEGTVSGESIVGSMNVGGPLPLTFQRVAALDPAPAFGEQERVDVTALVNNYFAAFSRKDWDALRNNIETVPFIRWGFSNTPNVVTVIDDVVKVSQTTRDALDNSDYALSRAAEMVIMPMSATTGMVDVHWRRDRKDGSLLQEGAEILTVTKTSNGWRINGVLNHALSHYGKRF